jgi:hypothetical protein
MANASVTFFNTDSESNAPFLQFLNPGAYLSFIVDKLVCVVR